MQATANLEEIEIDFSGISRHQGNKGGPWARRTAAAAADVIRAVLYLLLRAASRRFRGKSAVVPTFAKNLVKSKSVLKS